MSFFFMDGDVKEIEGLNDETIMPFIALITIHLQKYHDKVIFVKSYLIVFTSFLIILNDPDLI